MWKLYTIRKTGKLVIEKAFDKIWNLSKWRRVVHLEFRLTVDFRPLSSLIHSSPPPPKVKELMVSPLSICLSVSVHKMSQKKVGWIQMKLGGYVGCMTRKNWFNFGEDPDPDLIVFSVILHHREIRLNWYIAHLKKVGRIRVKLGGQVRCTTRTNRFDFGEDLDSDPTTRNFFKWFFTIEREGQKRCSSTV